MAAIVTHRRLHFLSASVLTSIATTPLLCVAGSALASTVDSTLLLPPRQEPIDPTCTFAGNSDIYGLGIRIGVYLQWVSGFLANNFHAEAVQDMLATNTIFLLALFTALAIITQKKSVQAIEVVIILQLCIGFLISVSTTWGLRVRARLTSGKEYGARLYLPLLGSTIRLCLASAIFSYNLWFWFRGLDVLRDPECPPSGFLFARVVLLHRARGFFEVTSIIWIIVCASITLAELFLFFWNWVWYTAIAGVLTVLIGINKTSHHSKNAGMKRALTHTVEYSSASVLIVIAVPWIMLNKDTGIRLRRHQSWNLLRPLYRALKIICGSTLVSISVLNMHHSWPRMLLFTKLGIEEHLTLAYTMARVGLYRLNETWASLRHNILASHTVVLVLPLMNLGCIMWSILAIELMISWNRITDVHTIQSVGQLIPFIIGVVGFVKLLRDIQVEVIQQRLFDEIMKSLLSFGGSAQAQNPAVDKELNMELAASSIFAHPTTAKVALEMLEQDQAHFDSTIPELLREALQFVSKAPPWEKLGFGIIGDSEHIDRGRAATDPTAQAPEPATLLERFIEAKKTPTFRESFLNYRIYISMLRNLREERKIAREANSLRGSVGDKIMELLRTDAAADRISIEKTNAMLALDILDRLKLSLDPEEREETGTTDAEAGTAEKETRDKQTWRMFSHELHKNGVNPNVLAMRWFLEYATFWWVHLNWRWAMHKMQLSKTNKWYIGSTTPKV